MQKFGEDVSVCYTSKQYYKWKNHTKTVGLT